MNLIQRIAGRLGFVTKDQLRSAMANFQTSAINRLTASWTATSLSADSQARMDLRTARARCRELRDNNDYAAKFISMVKTNVLGESGIHFRSKVKEADIVIGGDVRIGRPDVFANKTIEDAFWMWGRKQSCTVTGSMSWRDSQRVALEAAAVDGEGFIRKIKGNPTPENPYGFWLKHIEADYLDEQKNEKTVSGNEIRMGVEIDKDHKVIAYHFLTQNPSESLYYRSSRLETYRVPASDIIHLGIIRRAEQTRYNPWMITTGYRMNMVGKYEEAEVTAARAGASKMGFIVQSGNGPVREYTGETDERGNKLMEAEPGAIEQLPYGQDIKTIDWQHPSSAYQVFMKTALRGVAAGLGVSYNSLANDMESVNFASGKLGLMEEREVWKSLQAWFIESFCEEVFSSWLEHALLVGAIPLPYRKFEKFNSPCFRGRRWQYVNPAQDVDADIRQLNAGLTSISRILAERNIDRDELFDEIADDKAAAESRDIEFPELAGEPEVEVDAGGNSEEDDDADEENVAN